MKTKDRLCVTLLVFELPFSLIFQDKIIKIPYQLVLSKKVQQRREI